MKYDLKRNVLRIKKWSKTRLKCSNYCQTIERIINNRRHNIFLNESPIIILMSLVKTMGVTWNTSFIVFYTMQSYIIMISGRRVIFNNCQKKKLKLNKRILFYTRDARMYSCTATWSKILESSLRELIIL